VNDMAVIDGTGAVMGRLASHIAKRLMQGEEIHVVNCEHIIISGNKKMILDEFTTMREIGSKRKGPHYPKMPHRIFKRTVRGMVKYQQPSGRAALKRLMVHIGTPSQLAEENTEVIETAKPKGTGNYVALGDLSRSLGANVR